MKIIGVSDNHRDEHTLKQIMEREKESDIWIHCGDSQFDEHHHLLRDFHVVQGNTDHALFPKECIIECGKVRILVSHGHLYSIDFTVEEIVASAKMQGATLILHGHTHIPRDIEIQGVRIINPGSTSWPRGQFQFGSYIVIETESKQDVRDWDVTFISTKTWESVTIK